jgi:ribonuclease BN (tRNA processing enzyme)
MRLRFLGSGDAFGSGGRFNTCMHVEAAETTFLIDCGASSLIAMKRYGVAPNDIETILITHLHADHFGGLPFFILDAQFFSKRHRPLMIAGPPGLRKRLLEAQDLFFPGSSKTAQKFDLQIKELEPGETAPLNGLAVTPYEVNHDGDAPFFALRIEADGRTIAYSGDTEWTDALLSAARDTDLFICEAYFYDKPVPLHLDLKTLERHLPDIGTRRLVLTHMSDDMLNRLDQVEHETASDGMLVEL